jgi:hypothetical protein
MTPLQLVTADGERIAQLVEANARLRRAMEHDKQATCPAEKAAAKWDIIKAQAAMDLLAADDDLGEAPYQTRREMGV